MHLTLPSNSHASLCVLIRVSYRWVNDMTHVFFTNSSIYSISNEIRRKRHRTKHSNQNWNATFMRIRLPGMIVIGVVDEECWRKMWSLVIVALIIEVFPRDRWFPTIVCDIGGAGHDRSSSVIEFRCWKKFPWLYRNNFISTDYFAIRLTGHCGYWRWRW